MYPQQALVTGIVEGENGLCTRDGFKKSKQTNFENNTNVKNLVHGNTSKPQSSEEILSYIIKHEKPDDHGSEVTVSITGNRSNIFCSRSMKNKSLHYNLDSKVSKELSMLRNSIAKLTSIFLKNNDFVEEIPIVAIMSSLQRDRMRMLMDDHVSRYERQHLLYEEQIVRGDRCKCLCPDDDLSGLFEHNARELFEELPNYITAYFRTEVEYGLVEISESILRRKMEAFYELERSLMSRSHELYGVTENEYRTCCTRILNEAMTEWLHGLRIQVESETGQQEPQVTFGD